MKALLNEISKRVDQNVWDRAVLLRRFEPFASMHHDEAMYRDEDLALGRVEPKPVKK